MNTHSFPSCTPEALAVKCMLKHVNPGIIRPHELPRYPTSPLLKAALSYISLGFAW